MARTYDEYSDEEFISLLKDYANLLPYTDTSKTLIKEAVKRIEALTKGKADVVP